MKPIRLEMRLKNNRMVRTRLESGYGETVAEYCRSIGYHQSEYGRYENMKQSPLRICAAASSECLLEECSRTTSVKRVMCQEHTEHQSEIWGSAAKMWRGSAETLATVMGVTPEWLWPESVREIRQTNMAVAEISASEAVALGSATEAVELSGDIHAALALIRSADADVLIKRFGIGGNAPMTLEEIARSKGLSRERVRQLELRGLRELRLPSVRPILEGHIDE